MPNAKLRLHDIEDVYAFAATVVRRKLPDLSASVPEEDAVQALVVKLWQRAERFDGRGSFSGYAARFAGGLVVDVVREFDGRTRWSFSHHTYERRRPEVQSIDGYFGEGRDPQLDRALATREGDPAENGSADLARLLADGGW